MTFRIKPYQGANTLYKFRSLLFIPNLPDQTGYEVSPLRAECEKDNNNFSAYFTV